MARKRKTRQKNYILSPAQSRSQRSLLSPPKERKSGQYLTLAIMGGAAFFALKGCSDHKDDNDGDGVYYTSQQDCVDDGNTAQVCNDAWNNARMSFEQEIPTNMSQPACVQQYDHCYYDNIGQRWMPVLSGFLLSKAIRKDRDEQYSYSSGGSMYSSRPVWRNSDGDYSWRSGGSTSNTSAGSHYGYTTKKATTFSRGGFGRSSSARGSWGG
ncbi:Uncharacterized conserved protein YgiB, involved in bioifilm formation, UPF0441/DUF1190 family [Kosakonia oryzendophytica]|uniref:Uncharacterized conserved protein YgiB, involved in bioifilm formation, UPF0441/DUF1190 family n=1 Tax=Kosakonia oryzendophytica TaxID=1005665 RepID=A0A1C3ZVQ6_9ENTR|nr:DUF1190 domain-containing protein [Kosakonia oryzendophytica]SCB86459.1 Uncharacterized conserved protein YgiB, involved in bioifilm formation, UPF0441/DUF1190 family [Kosakonia oryzendophytica]